MFDKLNALAQRMDELEARLAEPGLYDDPSPAAKLLKERNELEPIIQAFRACQKARRAQEDALDMPVSYTHLPCIGAPDASLLLPVISLLDGHSLVKVLCGMKLPTAIIIADYS